MKTTQDLVMMLRELQERLGQGALSIQIFADKSYRIYDNDGGILLDSDDADKPEDINDLGYADVEELVDTIQEEQVLSTAEDEIITEGSES